MKLTGKCFESFNRWLSKNIDLYQGDCMECGGYIYFDELPDSMKWGVYQDFFEDKEISIGRDDVQTFWVFQDTSENYTLITNIETRAEAVEQANSIYNKNL